MAQHTIEVESIDIFRDELATSYGWAAALIEYRFARLDQRDPDYNTYLCVIYSICFRDAVTSRKIIKDIYSARAKIPQRLLDKAKQQRVA